MSTPNLVQTDVAELIKFMFERQIPLLWKQCFIAPMAFHGEYKRIKLPVRHMPGLELVMFKDRLECHYKGEVYAVDWAVGRPWHVKGDFVLSPNWRNGSVICAQTLSALTEHALHMAEHIIL